MVIPYLVSMYAIRMINQNPPMMPNATAVDGSLLKIEAIIRELQVIVRKGKQDYLP